MNREVAIAIVSQFRDAIEVAVDFDNRHNLQGIAANKSIDLWREVDQLQDTLIDLVGSLD